MNVALRVVHEGLNGGGGDHRQRWDLFVEALGRRCEANQRLRDDAVAGALRSVGLSGSAPQWLGNLRSLGVVDDVDRLISSRVREVGIALELVGDSFKEARPRGSWTAVATLPPEVRTLLRSPPFPQTAGVMLGLIDRSVHNLTLAAPFIDRVAVSFLQESMVTAMERGIKIDVLTSTGRGVELRSLVDEALRHTTCRLTVTELQTDISSLGSHAKVLLVDEAHAYVGSANLTSAGLGRHVEIGVELSGPQVQDLVRLIVALERLGRRVLSVADGRLMS